MNSMLIRVQKSITPVTFYRVISFFAIPLGLPRLHRPRKWKEVSVFFYPVDHVSRFMVTTTRPSALLLIRCCTPYVALNIYLRCIIRYSTQSWLISATFNNNIAKKVGSYVSPNINYPQSNAINGSTCALLIPIVPCFRG